MIIPWVTFPRATHVAGDYMSAFCTTSVKKLLLVIARKGSVFFSQGLACFSPIWCLVAFALCSPD